MDLKGKCAVVTGGAMGIGFFTAKRLLAEGATVTIWDINYPALTVALKELSEHGAIFGHRCDVTDKKRVLVLAETARREMGRVDILVNNAGFVSGGDFLERPLEDWEKTMDVNFSSILFTTRAFLGDMYERDLGHIVNVSSAAGTIGVPDLSVYSASKWAVWGFTESLRFEAWNRGKHGVRFSSIHPGYIKHGMFEGARLGFPGRLIVPRVKDHDVVAKAIVESALKKGMYSPKRPRTVNLNIRLRALMPDSWFQKFMVLMGVSRSMKTWVGRHQSEEKR